MANVNYLRYLFMMCFKIELLGDHLNLFPLCGKYPCLITFFCAEPLPASVHTEEFASND